MNDIEMKRVKATIFKLNKMALKARTPKQKTPVTDVIFRVWPKSEGGDVLALFPSDPGTNDQYTCSSYQHLGQHGSADPYGCIARTKPATPEQYAPLKRELESSPYYYRLRVVRRMTSKHLTARRQEIAR